MYDECRKIGKAIVDPALIHCYTRFIDKTVYDKKTDRGTIMSEEKTFTGTRFNPAGKTLNVKPLKTAKEVRDARFWLTHKRRTGERDDLLFMIGINSGLRCSDIVKLTVADMANLSNIQVKEQKTGKKRTINLEKLAPMIEPYIDGKDANEWLFPSYKVPSKHVTVNGVYQMFKFLEGKMERDDLGTHTMRKTFGYWFYMANQDDPMVLPKLMTLLNHSSQAQTIRYIGIDDKVLARDLKGFSVGI